VFLGLILSSLATAHSIIRKTRDRPDLDWAKQLAAAVQVSIVGYCAAGAFLNLGFYDLFYVLVAILVCTKVVITQDVAAARREGHPMMGLAPSLGTAFPGRPAPQGQLAARD
jgi:putative inorganic carbon (hco3(-)) transporter